MKKIKKKVGKKSNDEECSWDECCGNCKGKKSSGCGSCGYFLGALGAAIYYISTSTSFLGGLWGIIKALVWPAFVVFEIMKFLGM